jgi:small subunit ribosomal protein S8
MYKIHNTFYVLNLININKAKKNLCFPILFTIKNYQFVKILKKFNVIHDYKLCKKNNFNYIRITLFFYKNNPVCFNFRIISRQSKIFTISYQSLLLLTKKSGSSIFLISTSKGILSNKEAIRQKIGGILLGFFSI